METYLTGTLTGAGTFRCEACGFAVALHEQDALPDCPRCHKGRFQRSSLFAEVGSAEPWRPETEVRPEWLPAAREAITETGDFLAFDLDDQVQVLPVAEGFTRVGRSLAAEIRFDDPTVSRRHAIIHREGDSVRVLDDRSLNGVWVNGHQAEWHVLEDGDELAIGRYRLFFIRHPQRGAVSEGSGTSTATG